MKEGDDVLEVKEASRNKWPLGIVVKAVQKKRWDEKESGSESCPGRSDKIPLRNWFPSYHQIKMFNII